MSPERSRRRYHKSGKCLTDAARFLVVALYNNNLIISLQHLINQNKKHFIYILIKSSLQLHPPSIHVVVGPKLIVPDMSGGTVLVDKASTFLTY